MAPIQLITNNIVVLLFLSVIICYTTTTTTTSDRSAAAVAAFSTTISTTRKITTTKNVFITTGSRGQRQKQLKRCGNSKLYVANAISAGNVVGTTTSDSNSNFVMSSSSINNNNNNIDSVVQEEISSTASTQTKSTSVVGTTNGGAAKTLYEILGARSDETREQLKRRYLSLAKESHPDAIRQKTNSIENNNNKVQVYEFSEIAAAWRILSDTKERRRYDRSLQAERISEDIANWAGDILTKAATEWAMPFFQKQTAAGSSSSTCTKTSTSNNKQQTKSSSSSSSSYSYSQQKQQQQSVKPTTTVSTLFSSNNSNTINAEPVTASTTTTTMDSSSASSNVGQFDVPVSTPMEVSSYVHQQQELEQEHSHQQQQQQQRDDQFLHSTDNIDIIPTKEQYIIELEEKSDVLEQRAVSEYKLAVQLQYELQQLTRERLRLALGTAYSGISSSDAFQILHDIDTNLFSYSSSSSSSTDSDSKNGDGKEITSSNNNNNNNKSNHHHIPFSPVKSFWRAATQSTSEYVQDEIKTLENLEIMYIDVQQVDNVIQELYNDQIRQRAYAKDELDYLCEQEELARQQYINAKNAVAEQKQLFQLLCNEVSYSEHQSQKSSYDIERKSISVQEQSEHVRIALLKRITNGIKQQQQQQTKNRQHEGASRRQQVNQEEQQQHHHIDMDEAKSTSSSILSNKQNSLFTSQNNDNVDLQMYQNFLDNSTSNNKQLQQSSTKENSNNNSNNNAYLLEELSSIRQQEQQLAEQISRYEIKAAKILSRANRIRQQSINETR